MAKSSNVKMRYLIVMSSSESSEDEISPCRKPTGKRRGKIQMATENSPLPAISKIYTSELAKFRTKVEDTLVTDKKINVHHTDEEDFAFPNKTPAKPLRRSSRKTAQKVEVKAPTEVVEPESNEFLPPDVVDETIVVDEIVPIPKKTKRNRTTNKLLKSLNQASNLIGENLGSSSQEAEVIEYEKESFPGDRPVEIKVRCLSEVHRLPIHLSDPFHNLVPILSTYLSLPENKLFLTWNGNTIDLKESPASVNFQLCDILDCWALENDIKKTQIGSENAKDPNKITIYLQTSDGKKKDSIECNKDKPFQCIIEEYSKMKNIELEKVALIFDGERVDPSDTPSSMDVEDGECFDVKIS